LQGWVAPPGGTGSPGANKGALGKWASQGAVKVMSGGVLMDPPHAVCYIVYISGRRRSPWIGWEADATIQEKVAEYCDTVVRRGQGRQIAIAKW